MRQIGRHDRRAADFGSVYDDTLTRIGQNWGLRPLGISGVAKGKEPLGKHRAKAATCKVIGPGFI